MMGAYRHFPILIIAVPLVTAVLMPALSYRARRACMPVAAAALASSIVLTLLLYRVVKPAADGYLSYHLGGWEPPWGIEIRVDFTGLFMLTIVCCVSLAALVYSRRYVEHELEEGKLFAYYSLFLLLSASMLGFTATGDIFNMFVFMEILALSSYALVAVTGRRDAVRAAFKYLLMGAPSSIMVLFAIALLYSVTGSLNMADLKGIVAQGAYSRVLFASLVFFVMGFGVKAALFPLHGWLPDAHSIAPSPISAMLSGLVVEVAAFAILRVFFSVFGAGASAVSGTAEALGVIAAAGVLYGGVMAVMQKDFKMMVAYSTVSHIGYIILGISIMNEQAVTGALYHLLDHGLAKGCFFLCAGAVIYRRGYRRIDQLKGAARQMPWTCAAFSLAAMSVIGIPPTAGFISKWYLIWGSVAGGRYLYAAVYLTGSILAAVYCLRLIYYMFFVAPPEGSWEGEGKDAPPSMLIPIWVLSLGTLVMGVFSFVIINRLQEAVGWLL
jgi:multicomponent Na+:H+ antiporter subunit D